MSTPSQLRYVVLRHTVETGVNSSEAWRDCQSHYDLMLEEAGRLLTWEIGTWPPRPATSQPIVPLSDHRLAYLTFEGEISGNRGTVARVDEGHYRREPSDSKVALFALQGKGFKGLVKIDEQKLTVLQADLQ